ncbi:6403a560-b84f-4b60-8971-d0016be78bd9 [Sclerotinia trifoliorum]|uniref:6403a560-b84f-4b60-8971-d0016be78bd9 n=1 Tax=Sclerotinia trifoliorum TaxID=28548 RepID=A0A8H2VRV3_9HELO|nr:6403a560-b84f-4b60-8971-d0016be78bd9 [Sclerotinia trifoliorum]
MPNPFARPMEYLPSMNRQGITVCAHDVINELSRLGVLDPGNEALSKDLFGVYKNLEEFYKWVCSRPRIAPQDAPRPLQLITRHSEIFTLAHKLWDNLEFELALEKDGAFVEEMMDHLGWFWNIKSNLRNKIHRIQGLPLISKMDTLAEAASYALRFNNISRGNVIEPPSVRPVASVNHLKSQVAPGSKKNPKDSGAMSPESRVRKENPSNNTMRSNRAPSLANTQKTNTGHLKVPQYSPSVQGQPQVSMRRSPSSYSTQQLNPRSTIKHQSPNLPDGTPRNFVDLMDVDVDYYSSAEQTSIHPVPTGFILPTTQNKGDKYPNRVEGFADGSMRPILSMSGVEPAVGNGSDHANHGAPRNSSRDLADSHGERKSSEPRDSPCDSGFGDTAESSNANMNTIIESSSPESENTTMEDSGTQDHKNRPTSAVLSSENSKGKPLDRRSDEQESKNTGGTELERPNSTSIDEGIITDKNIKGDKANNSTSANGSRRNIQGRLINSTDEATMKGAISVTSTHNNITENNMADIKAKRYASVDGSKEDISENPNKKVKTSAIYTAPSSEYSSPYMSLSNQNQPSTTAKSTTSAAVDEHVSEKHGSKKPVSEDSSSTSPK